MRELDSGMALTFKPITSPVAYCSLTIRAGTRDEPLPLNGLAHLTEHMLFKGTKRRSSKRINTYLERLGGELNAYTAKEETVLHATFLKEDLNRALELLSDIIFNSTFPEKELRKEREVILEEISSYGDTPSEQIFDDFEEMLFGLHPLSKSILGRAETLMSIEVEHIKEFVEKFYHPGAMTLSIVGDFKEKPLLRYANRYFGAHLKGREAGRKNPLFDLIESGVEKTDREDAYNKSSFNSLFKPKESIVARNTFQSHAVVGLALKEYSLYSPKRYAMALLTNLLGGPALNSKLNTTLRERHGLVYNVEANYSPFSDLGLFTIYFGTENNNIERCMALLQKELTALFQKELSPLTFKSAKKQLLGQLAIAGDNAEVQCLSMGKSQLFLGYIESDKEIMEKIESIDAAQLHSVAREVLNWDNFSRLIYR